MSSPCHTNKTLFPLEKTTSQNITKRKKNINKNGFLIFKNLNGRVTFHLLSFSPYIYLLISISIFLSLEEEEKGWLGLMGSSSSRLGSHPSRPNRTKYTFSSIFICGASSSRSAIEVCNFKICFLLLKIEEKKVTPFDYFIKCNFKIWFLLLFAIYEATFLYVIVMNILIDPRILILILVAL